MCVDGIGDHELRGLVLPQSDARSCRNDNLMGHTAREQCQNYQQKQGGSNFHREYWKISPTTFSAKAWLHPANSARKSRPFSIDQSISLRDLLPYSSEPL